MPKSKNRRFWSTLQEYEDRKSVEKLKETELYSKFLDDTKEEALEASSSNVENESRRNFLKLSGAAAVLAMVSCTERRVEKILPYVNAPEEVVPGVANYYASSCDEARASVLVKTREGRPIAILPNDKDEVSGSGLNARAFASIVDLYDPARARMPLKIDRTGNGIPYIWEDAYVEISNKIKEAKGQIVLLTGTINGPTRERLIKDVSKGVKNFRHVVVDAESNDELISANIKSLGTKNLAHYAFDKAETVVFLGGDAFADGRDAVKWIEGVSKNRRVVETGTLSRLFSFEPTLTETGLNVDYRYSVRNEDMVYVAMSLAYELVINQSLAYDSSVHKVLSPFEPAFVEKKLSLKKGTIKFIAQDLKKSQGKSIVYAEGNANKTKNGEALHIAVNFLNSILGNIGKTVDFAVNYGKQSLGSRGDLSILIDDMKAGKVSVLMVYGTNPSYFLGADSQFDSGVKNVEMLVSFADRIDETAYHFDYLLPSTHSLESWGDREYINGHFTMIQPTINPIWDNCQFEFSLRSIVGLAGYEAFYTKDKKIIDDYSYLRDTWKEIHKKENIAATFEQFWVSIVREGFYDSIKKRNNFTVLPFIGKALSGVSIDNTSDEMTLSVFVSSTKGDGTQGNNPYLMELPDPVSKVAWDNFLALSPDTAKELGLWINDIVEIDVNGTKTVLPLHIQPGTHRKVATIAVGWGRTAAGPIGDGNRDSSGKRKGQGINAYRFTKANRYSGNPIVIKKAVGKYKLADVQGHHYLDDKQRTLELHDSRKENYRPIVFEATLNEYKENPNNIVEYHTEELTNAVKKDQMDNMWTFEEKDYHEYPGHHWGMVVDLNSCIGCNACVIACQIENNIPVVGREEVLIGREMHWMRIDRYYIGEQENPSIAVQPMFCQHCDNAPCETVCPVVATTHNQEGLNIMTYNRCVGTRYCANNCPYKVRRFNFHEYTKGDATKGFPNLGLGEEHGLNKKGYDLSEYPMQMMLNPDITVREKGVMEKCTMCSHKIREAKYEAKLQGISINDLDNLSTACETACPANAITFGDMNDETSKVSQLKKSPINFGSLAELNIRPSVSYVSIIRNQEEALLDSEKSDD